MKIRHLWLALTTVLVLGLNLVATAQQEIPAAINYQGKLTDNLGNALTNGYYVVEFRLWKDPTQTIGSDLAWGRSFPIHVVEGGLFNVLLSNDGSTLADGGTGDLLTSFDGPDRYLGLTVVQTPAGTVSGPAEIKPRQRLVSAPYTIQAQTANRVATAGVLTDSLANASVTTAKIAVGNVTSGSLANNAVVTAKIADSAVTTAKIADGAVTSAKLNIDTELRLNNHPLYLRGGSEVNHGLKWTNSFGGQSMDGPALFGFGSGVLGTTSGGEKAALMWDDNQAVAMKGAVTVSGATTLQSAVTISNGPVSMFGALQTMAKNVPHTASTDGFIIVTALNRFLNYRIWPVGASTNAPPTIDQTEYFNVAGANTFTMAMPVAKGETWQLDDLNNFGGTSTHLNISWRPMGK